MGEREGERARGREGEGGTGVRGAMSTPCIVSAVFSYHITFIIGSVECSI
jgi:hypothetical protein